MEEEEQIDQRGAVAFQIAFRKLMLALLGGIIGKQCLCCLTVDSGNVHKLAESHFVAKTIAVQRLDVGKPGRAFHFVAASQFIQQCLLRGIIAGWDQHGNDIACAERIIDFRLRRLILCLFERRNHVHIIGIVAAAVHDVSADDQQHKNRRNNKPCGMCKTADKGDLRYKVSMPGLVHGFAEQHQHSRHEEEHRQQTADDGFDQVKAHVRAEAELHKGHSREAGNGREAAGGDLGNRCRQCFDDGVMHIERLMLFLIAVAEDDGIVHRKRQLQHDSH